MSKKTRMKVLSILMLLVFIIPALPSPEVKASDNLNWGKVERRQGVCIGLKFTVSSPGTAQVFFRTEQLQIIIFGNDGNGQTISGTAIFTYSDLQAKGFYGSSGTQDIIFTVREIAQQSGLTEDQIRQVADTGGFTLGAVLGIYDGSNRIAEITRADQVEPVCGPNNPTCGYTFPQAARDDMRSRWGVAYDPQQPPEKPNLTAEIEVLNSSGSVVNSLDKGKQYTIRGIFSNNSTLTCNNAHLRAYCQGSNENDLRALTSYADNISAGQSLVKTWFFTATEGKNVLCVSINREYQGYGGYLNEKFESGQKLLDETTWNDNWAETSFYAADPESGSSGGSDTSPSAYDLAAVAGKIVDSQGQTANIVEVNQIYGVQATFRSDFMVGGFAKLRLYRIDDGFTLIDTIGVYFEPGPNRHLTYTWQGINIRDGNNRFFANIDIKPDGSHELFDGKYEETRWDNNSVTINVTGTATELPPEEPPVHDTSFWFPVWEPSHEEIQITHIKVPVYGYKEVKFIPAPRPKVHVMLVPHDPSQ